MIYNSIDIRKNRMDYITVRNCKEYIKSDNICVFGAYKEAETLYSALKEIKNIVCFIDNYRHGGILCGKEVISFETYLTRYKGLPIIIASRRYAFDIAEQLKKAQMQLGTNFWIWDNSCLFHETEAMIEFIEKNESIWKDNIKSNHQILVPVLFSHSVSTIVRCSYYSNYFSETYGAELVGYGFCGLDADNISTSVKKIYHSFNVNNYVDIKNGDEYEEEINEILKCVWDNLYTWKDWKKIYIYGIHFGTTLLRDFFRYYMPPDDMRDDILYNFLKKSIRTIVFWKHYFENNLVDIVLMIDGTHWDGYIRDIAISNNIPVYSIGGNVNRLTYDFAEKRMFQYFDTMWDTLTEKEQKYGIEWAKERIQERINGDAKDINEIDKSGFSFAIKTTDKRVLRDTDNLKLLICPHSFEEDCYWYGEHIFDDNYYSWLCHLGELSEKTPDYEWYVKPHPTATGRDPIILQKVLDKYPKLICIKGNVSPKQLYNEGIRFAFTESGTLGHEYPAIGIQVINAGLNPHSKFDFCWNPKNEEEFDELVFNLKNVKTKNDMGGLYKFYALKYLFYDWDYLMNNDLFFENEILKIPEKALGRDGKPFDYEMYDVYMKEFSMEKHKRILERMPEIVRRMDEWRPDVLYKKHFNLCCQND